MPKIEPKCPYFGVCGGCALQDVAYADQVIEKKRLIDEAFVAAAIDVPAWEIISSDNDYYYRNRMDYPFGYQGELGLKARGKWWKTLDLTTCFLLSPETPEIMQRVRDWSKKMELPFWNVKTHLGFLRYLVIREGKNTGERLIMLVTSATHPFSDDQKKSFVDLLNDVATSIIWGVNNTITDLSIPNSIEVLKGNPYLQEQVNGITYHIQPASFFQTNTQMAAKLQDTVVEFCGEINNKKVMDLYCGAGFFSLALAREAKDVVGVELDAAAIEAAKVNAEVNNISNTRFLASKAEEYDWVSDEPDVVVIDPPRSGLHKNVLLALTKAHPQRIVYVSCKYQKMIEELPQFLPHYKITAVRALDLFPQTPHVELVVQLTKIC